MSVRKRVLRDGEIRWQVDYRDGTGTRRHRQFQTKREADAFHAKARTEVVTGVHTPDSASITIAAAADLWIARCERDGLERTTILAYQQHVNLHIVPYLGSVKLSRLSGPTVNAFRDQLLDAGRSRDMVRRVLASLTALVGEAQARGLVAVNNVRAVTKTKRGKRAEPRIEMPPMDELRAIIAATPDRHRPMILTALLAGLRASELRGLFWEDVDLKQGEIHVRRRVDRFNKFGPPKSEAGTRTIPMSPLLANSLRQWRLVCPKGELGLVFPNGAGKVENHGNLLSRIFWPIQIAAGVTVPLRDGQPDAKYSLHALRHACAALWIEQGFGPKRIQVLMGHATVAMTFDRYGYLFEAREADAMAMAAITAKLVD